MAPAPAILEAIERAYGANTVLLKIVEGMGAAVSDGHAEPEEDVDHLRDMAFEAPVVRLVNLLIDGALAADASDIHIEPFEDSLRVRYRIDGLLYHQEAPTRRLQATLTSRIKIMAELNIAERRLPRDGRIRVTSVPADPRYRAVPGASGTTSGWLRPPTRPERQYAAGGGGARGVTIRPDRHVPEGRRRAHAAHAEDGLGSRCRRPLRSPGEHHGRGAAPPVLGRAGMGDSIPTSRPIYRYSGPDDSNLPPPTSQ